MSSESGLIPAIEVEREEDKSTFASLKNRDYMLLWIGMLGSALLLAFLLPQVRGIDTGYR